MRKKILICFIGMDGSGKTTLSHSFLEKLKKRGISCKYVHGLIWPKLLKPFLIIGRKILSNKKVGYPGDKSFRRTKENVFLKYPFLIFLYKTILFADYVPQILWKVYSPFYKEGTIISDRYIYDTVIYMGLNLGYDVDRLGEEIKRWFRVLPKPDVTFLLDIDENVAFRRKDDISSVDYLRERRGLYLGLAAKLGIPVLDGSEPIYELCNKVERVVKSSV